MSGSTVIALGGNAISPPSREGTAQEQTLNLHRAMEHVAHLVAEQNDPLVITHGNGPQVGDLMTKNELARDQVAVDPLDWCVAQTQATIGFTIANTLEAELKRRGISRPVVPLISRVLVDADDPAFDEPTKPVGPYVTDEAEVDRRRDEGQRFVQIGDKGWRRVVASPEPIACVDQSAIETLLGHGAIVVANGGGGIPVVDPGFGPLRGIEAVIDKDLAGSLLAEQLKASSFAILTDVPGVAVGYGTPEQRWLHEVSVSELRSFEQAGEFAAGSMGPKVAAVRRFVERTGSPARIGALSDARAVLRGDGGTRVRQEAA